MPDLRRNFGVLVMRRAEALARMPVVFGLKEAEAAVAVGVSVGHFRKLRERNLMPGPRNVGGVPVYDVDELHMAFRALPHDGAGVLPAGDDLVL